MVVSHVFSLALMGLAGLLLDSHRRARRKVVTSTDMDDRERRFATSQYRRRMLASGSIAVVGVAIAVRPIVPPRPLPMTLYLLMLVLACGWILTLALVDVLATGFYYRQLRSRHISAEIKLARQLQEARDRANSTAP